ncbi:protein Churchill-like [Tubulanus polymorphus]|uniref:protein Churchill-like n=1 Tax=Tubulanus polymorphus TaxID=672921 RepID=UPI003DA5582B
MCNECVKEQYPNRENICIESGSYRLNYAGCADCQSKEIKTTNLIKEEEDNEETIKYEHTCADCNHVIANHEYTFEVDDDFQHYTMMCELCGCAEDQRSILPYDPRAQQELFI